MSAGAGGEWQTATRPAGERAYESTGAATPSGDSTSRASKEAALDLNLLDDLALCAITFPARVWHCSRRTHALVSPTM